MTTIFLPFRIVANVGTRFVADTKCIYLPSEDGWREMEFWNPPGLYEFVHCTILPDADGEYEVELHYVGATDPDLRGAAAAMRQVAKASRAASVKIDRSRLARLPRDPWYIWLAARVLNLFRPVRIARGPIHNAEMRDAD